MMGWRFLLKGLRWQLMLAMTTVAMTVVAQRITTPSQTIDCGQVLFRNPVTAHFELTNEGSGNVTIKSVDTSCGCTGVSYPVGIISENKPFVVSATYDAKQMGHFEKYIDIYTNGASLPFTLTMRGVVVGEIKDFGGQYPFTSGKLLLIFTGLFLLAGLLIGAAAILLSRALNNVIAAGGVICFTVLADLFLTIPPKFRILSQIRFLTPLQVLVNSSMADPRLFRIGSTYLTAFQISAILYAVLILAFSFGTIFLRRKS